MEPPIHDLSSLFSQLGLDNTEEAIENLIRRNNSLPANVKLHKAEFWNSSQASFLKQAKDEDADWAEIVDQLDVMLR